MLGFYATSDRMPEGRTANDTAAGGPGARRGACRSKGTPARPVTASAVTESAGLGEASGSERSRQAAC